MHAHRASLPSRRVALLALPAQLASSRTKLRRVRAKIAQVVRQVRSLSHSARLAVRVNAIYALQVSSSLVRYGIASVRHARRANLQSRVRASVRRVLQASGRTSPSRAHAKHACTARAVITRLVAQHRRSAVEYLQVNVWRVLQANLRSERATGTTFVMSVLPVTSKTKLAKLRARRVLPAATRQPTVRLPAKRATLARRANSAPAQARMPVVVRSQASAQTVRGASLSLQRCLMMHGTHGMRRARTAQSVNLPKVTANQHA